MTHQISPELIAHEAASVLARYFKGPTALNDGREYNVSVVDQDGTTVVIEVRGSKFLDVEETEFVIDVRARENTL